MAFFLPPAERGVSKHIVYVIPERGGKVPLGRRMQGLKGLRQPPAGKLETSDRSLASCGKRETAEEMRVHAKHLHLAGVVQTKSSKGEPRTIWCFLAAYKGRPRGSREMEDPRNFRIDALPYREMHPEAEHWMPKVLNNGRTRRNEPVSLVMEFCPNGNPIGARDVPMPTPPRSIY